MPKTDYYDVLTACNNLLSKLPEKEFEAVSGASYLLYISSENFIILESLYGKEFIAATSKEIKKALLGLLGNKVEIVEFPNLSFFLVLHQVENIHDKVKKIRTFLQGFGSSQVKKDLFLIMLFASVRIDPTEKLAAEEWIKKLFVTLNHLRLNCGYFHMDNDDIGDQSFCMQNEMHQANSFLKAINDNQLVLFFQPIIDSKSGKTEFYECLLRIKTPGGGYSSVGPYIPVAEKFAFTDQIDEKVLEMVIATLEDHPAINLSFNISGMCLANNNWLRKANEYLQNRPDLASRIIVEITETVVLRDLGKAAYFVASLQELGCKVALDDFGAGHTSFRQLKVLSIDIIKIDGSFVRDIVNNSANRVLLKLLIDVCQNFNIKSVAEFVESGDVVKTLMQLQVNYMQGNFLGPASANIGEANSS